jgi:hypothetical protein
MDLLQQVAADLGIELVRTGEAVERRAMGGGRLGVQRVLAGVAVRDGGAPFHIRVVAGGRDF